MKVGLIDVDNRDNLSGCFPNLALMKLSAFHKAAGDQVEWYEPMLSGHLDRVYMSKVFSFSPDYEYFIDASEIIGGGTGFSITTKDGREVFNQELNKELPKEIEHIMPDYSLYGIKDTAYGFMSRGCPRGCEFCHVKHKEGRTSYKVANLSEFWNGQKNIELLDPNTLACKEWKEILEQLAASKAWVNFNQGLDARLLTDEKIAALLEIKIKAVHFAWDRYEDGKIIKPKLEAFKNATNWGRSKVSVYVLCGFDTTMEQNVERIEYLKNLDFNPYVMLYDKEHIQKGDELRKLQRYVNNKYIFWSCKSFDEYKKTN